MTLSLVMKYAIFLAAFAGILFAQTVTLPISFPPNATTTTKYWCAVNSLPPTWCTLPAASVPAVPVPTVAAGVVLPVPVTAGSCSGIPAFFVLIQDGKVQFRVCTAGVYAPAVVTGIALQ
jgi:hypothetical protein